MPIDYTDDQSYKYYDQTSVVAVDKSFCSMKGYPIPFLLDGKITYTAQESQPPEEHKSSSSAANPRYNNSKHQNVLLQKLETQSRKATSRKDQTISA